MDDTNTARQIADSLRNYASELADTLTWREDDFTAAEAVRIGITALQRAADNVEMMQITCADSYKFATASE